MEDSVLVDMEVADTVAATSVYGGQSLPEIFGQAGGFQWPIFVVGLIGLLILGERLGRHLIESRSSRFLRFLNPQEVKIKEVRWALKARKGRRDRESLWATLQGLIEMWEGGAGSVALSQEVTIHLTAARETYLRTQRYIAFLASTAGGIGLLGTLVGIYVLFSSGSRDPQTIFAGIAIAVVSTLLGIVVAILLELLEAVLSSRVGRYIEHAEAWGSTLRRRLVREDAVAEE